MSMKEMKEVKGCRLKRHGGKGGRGQAGKVAEAGRGIKHLNKSEKKQAARQFDPREMLHKQTKRKSESLRRKGYNGEK